MASKTLISISLLLLTLLSYVDCQPENVESCPRLSKEIRTQYPKTCLDVRCQGHTTSGVYTIYPTGNGIYPLSVYCDQTTDGGGWTVFQRRMDGTVDFFRNWYNYKLGFGEVNGEHWLGNDRIVELLSAFPSNELRFDMEAVSSEKAYAKYGNFSIGDETTDYRLTVNDYNGTAGDSFGDLSGQRFSTMNRDHDSWQHNCAERYKGAWWYKSCHYSNLNGFYYNGNHTSVSDGVNWRTWRGYHESLETTEMKLRGRP